MLVGIGDGVSPAARRIDPFARWWRAVATHLSRAELVAAGAASVLVLGFVYPTAYTAPNLRAVVETVMTLFGVAAAALLCQQFLRTRRLRTLLLLGGLATFALSEFVASALPAALHLRSGNGFTAAVPLAQLIVAALLLGAARASSDRLVIGARRPIVTIVLVSVGSVVFAELVGLLLLTAGLLGRSSSPSGIRGALQHPLGFVILLVAVACFAQAAVEFNRRARLERNRVLPLLALAALLLAAARLYNLALPRLSPESISLREALRLLAFGVIFIAALRGDFELRAAVARIAAVAERRRVAQDLHDGLAQDLALIAAHGALVSEQLGDEHPLALAARHALALSRDTISELADCRSASLGDTLEAIGYELGARYQAQVIVEVPPGFAQPGETADEVARIMREAIANAARHGGAKHIFVSLKQIGGAAVLRVVDDGCGVAGPSGMASEGFGIRSMRERAAALGGSLTFRPTGGKGTDLQVVFR